jgi:predicted acetyltransferase
MDLRYAPPANDDELRAYLAIGFQSLVGTPLPPDPGFVAGWLARTKGYAQMRVMYADGAIAAGMFDIDLGIFLGGRSVKMAGVSFVGVAPEHRGRGVAGAMIRAHLREAHARGCPVAGLYPAANALYRSTGYGFAGWYATQRIALDRVQARPGARSVRKATPQDHPAIEGLYRAQAQRANGLLDRNGWAWGRVLEPMRGGPAYAFVVEAADASKGPGHELEGYVVFTQAPLTGRMGYELNVLDWCARTAGGHQAILGLLAAHRSVAPSATFHPAPSDPFLALLDELPREGFESRFDWMLRITHLAAALEARGYPKGARGELHLDVVDDVIEENAGRWVVTLEGGNATVRRGGEGALRAHVRALATMYTGHRTPWSLARTGEIEADDATLERAAEAFAGPAPYMVDFF